MIRKLLVWTFLALSPLCAEGADAIWFSDGPGQTLYVRVRTSATSSVSAELEEGTSDSVGFYYVTDADLVTAGLTVAGTYPYKIFVGSPSASADDLQVGMGVLAWSGSAALPAAANPTHWAGAAVATPDTAGYPKVTVKSGTGTGELNIASGVVDVDLRQILGTALSEHEPGNLATGFRLFFHNVEYDGPNGASAMELLTIDGNTEFVMQPSRRGTAQAGTSTTITLDSSASSVDDYYNGSVVQIVNGPGLGQSRIISDYVGSTKVATLSVAWATTPTSSSLFAIWP